MEKRGSEPRWTGGWRGCVCEEGRLSGSKRGQMCSERDLAGGEEGMSMSLSGFTAHSPSS